SCSATATDMNFGNFDGSADLTATPTIGVTCTNGHAYHVALNAGSTAGSTIANRTLTNGTSTLAYNLYRDAGFTQIWGDTPAANHTVPGELPAAGNLNATTGNYSSTITVTVTY